MLKEWYDKGGPQNRPEGYEVKSWIFLPQHGKSYSVVDADSLENYIETKESLERIIGIYYWTLCRFRSNSSYIL